MGFGVSSSAKQMPNQASDSAQAAQKGNIFNPYSRAAVGNKAAYVESGAVYSGGPLNTGFQTKNFKGNYYVYTEQPSNDPTLIAALATLANRESSPSPPLPPITPENPTGAAAPAAAPTLATRITDAVKNGLKSITDFAVTKGTDGKTTINAGVWVIVGIVAVLFVWRKFRTR